MEQIVYALKLDMRDTGIVNTSLRLKQGDSGMKIEVNVFNGGTPAFDPLTTPKIVFRRPDGAAIMADMTVGVSSYNYTLVGNELQVPGKELIDVKFPINSDGRESTMSCSIDVVPDTITPNTHGSGIYDNDLAQILTKVEADVDAAEDSAEDAEAWAVGERGGVPVDPTDPTYHNNAKYYAEEADPTTLSSLTDTNISSPTDGQILKYDAASEKWINGAGEGSVSELNDLDDVNISSVTNGQVLTFNGTGWKNEDIPTPTVPDELNDLDDVAISSASNGQALLYDSTTHKWKNGDAPSGAGGSTVTITTAESALFGQAVTITDGVDTFTGTFDNAGNCEIQGVTITGTATVSATGGGQTATASLTMPYFGNYSTTLAFFSATVNVTFPYANGASCTLSDGVTTLTANNSPMAFNIPNTGTWTATVTLDGQTKTDSATITSDGQTASLTIEYGTINLSYDNDFKGETITCTSGGTTITKTAPNDANAMVFYPPTTGNWSISGTVGGVIYTASPDPIIVSSLSTAVSANLQTFATINVTLYGAKEDTITFTDAAGVAHTEVFASGQTSKSVTLKILPSGSTIAFTSLVAKNPSNLSQNYSKNVSLTTNTTAVYVMPDNTVYWYGYKPIEYLASIPSGCSVTENKNSINIYSVHGSGGDCALTFNKQTTGYSNIKAYATNVYSTNFNRIAYGNSYIAQSVTSTNDYVNITSDAITVGNLASYQNKYPIVGEFQGEINLYALWYE